MFYTYVQKSVTELTIGQILLVLKFSECRNHITVLSTSVYLDSGVYPDHMSVCQYKCINEPL